MCSYITQAEDTMAKALAAQAASLEIEKQNMNYPKEWKMDPDKKVEIDDDDAPNGKRTVQLPVDDLVRVDQTDPEYWEVYDELKRAPNPEFAKACPKTGKSSDTRGMHDAWITSLHRIQNTDLFTYFESQKKRLIKSNGPAPIAVRT
jgi:hypothetical protein|eukprot:COSAG06_NODE_527_length_14654_cov_6.880179_2_plen_147_part_00